MNSSNSELIAATDPQLLRETRLQPIPDAAEEDEDARSGPSVLSKANAYKSKPRPTLLQKIEVLDWHRKSDTKNQVRTLEHFNTRQDFSITKSSLNRWVSQEAKLREEYNSLKIGQVQAFHGDQAQSTSSAPVLGPRPKAYKTKPRYKHPEVDRCLELFYEQGLHEGKKVSERLLFEKWAEFYRRYHDDTEVSLGEETNITNKSKAWLFYFKRRSSVKKKLMETYHSSKPYSTPSLDHAISTLKEICKCYPHHHQIYQFDEISFSLKVIEKLVHYQRPSGSHKDDPCDHLSFTNPTNRIIVGLLVNADGSSKFPPLILAPSDHVEHSNTKDTDHLYTNKTCMLTSEILYSYLSQLDKSLKNKVIIMMDNLQAHFIPSDYFDNIQLIYLDKELNGLKYTPLDYGILRFYKSMVKKSILQIFLRKMLIQNEDLKFGHADLVAFSLQAWEELVEQNQPLICQCFKKSGILPCNDGESSAEPAIEIETEVGTGIGGQDKPISIIKDTDLEAQLIAMLKVLHEKGVTKFPSSMESFVFPTEEKVVNVHMNEQDILNLVNKEFDSSEDSSLDLDSSVNVKSTDDESQAVVKLCMQTLKPYLDQNGSIYAQIQFAKFLNTLAHDLNSQFMDKLMSDQQVKAFIERKRKRDD